MSLLKKVKNKLGKETPCPHSVWSRPNIVDPMCMMPKDPWLGYHWCKRKYERCPWYQKIERDLKNPMSEFYTKKEGGE